MAIEGYRSHVEVLWRFMIGDIEAAKCIGCRDHRVKSTNMKLNRSLLPALHPRLLNSVRPPCDPPAKRRILEFVGPGVTNHTATLMGNPCLPFEVAADGILRKFSYTLPLKAEDPRTTARDSSSQCFMGQQRGNPDPGNTQVTKIQGEENRIKPPGRSLGLHKTETKEHRRGQSPVFSFLRRRLFLPFCFFNQTSILSYPLFTMRHGDAAIFQRTGACHMTVCWDIRQPSA